ncbi:MAG: CRISPR-associated endonuclease Cas2 [Chloroflexi bacterium]|nr:CRISPR-associated endonuclease Cas2 [Chloroflexota bacterium]
MKHFLVISYDISNNKNRLKVMKALEDHGKRVQFSVFECILTPRQIEQLQNRLKSRVSKLDSVRFYYVNADDVNRIEVLGKGGITRESTFFMQ